MREGLIDIPAHGRSSTRHARGLYNLEGLAQEERPFFYARPVQCYPYGVAIKRKGGRSSFLRPFPAALIVIPRYSKRADCVEGIGKHRKGNGLLDADGITFIVHKTEGDRFLIFPAQTLKGLSQRYRPFNIPLGGGAVLKEYAIGPLFEHTLGNLGKKIEVENIAQI